MLKPESRTTSSVIRVFNYSAITWVRKYRLQIAFHSNGGMPSQHSSGAAQFATCGLDFARYVRYQESITKGEGVHPNRCPTDTGTDDDS